MTHDDFRELIQRELDEDLSPEECKLLEAHVITCAACYKEREEYKKLVNGLAKLSKVMPERSFVSQMMPDLPSLTNPAHDKSSAPASNKKRRSSSWMRGLSVAAVVVLAIGFTTHWKFMFGSSTGTGVQVADNQVSGQSQAKSGDSHTGQTTPTQQAGVQTKTESTTDNPVVTDKGSASQTGFIADDQQGETANGHPLFADSVQETKTLRQASNLPNSQTVENDKSTTQTPASPSGNKAGNTGLTAGALQGLNSDNNGKKSDVTGSGTNSAAGIGVPLKSHLTGPGSSGSVGTGNQGVGAQGEGNNTAPLAIVGPVQNPPADLNSQLQANVKSGQAAWATHPAEVVERHLTVLGFSQTADVLATPIPSRVQVIQGDVYMVTLTQPFEQDPQGIWVPVQISHIVNQQNPNLLDKPVVQYFNQLKTNGTIVDVGNLEILQNTAARVIVSATVVQENQAGGNTATTKLYDFPVAQQANGTWVLNGTPQVK